MILAVKRQRAAHGQLRKARPPAQHTVKRDQVRPVGSIVKHARSPLAEVIFQRHDIGHVALVVRLQGQAFLDEAGLERFILRLPPLGLVDDQGVATFVATIDTGIAAIFTLAADGHLAVDPCVILEDRFGAHDDGVVENCGVSEDLRAVEHHCIRAHVGGFVHGGGVCNPTPTVGVSLATGLGDIGDRGTVGPFAASHARDLAGLPEDIIVGRRGVRRARAGAGELHVVGVLVCKPSRVHGPGRVASRRGRRAQGVGRCGHRQPIATVAGLGGQGHFVLVPQRRIAAATFGVDRDDARSPVTVGHRVKVSLEVDGDCLGSFVGHEANEVHAERLGGVEQRAPIDPFPGVDFAKGGSGGHGEGAPQAALKLGVEFCHSRANLPEHVADAADAILEDAAFFTHPGDRVHGRVFIGGHQRRDRANRTVAPVGVVAHIHPGVGSGVRTPK